MLFEQDFHEISKREGQLRKILEILADLLQILLDFQEISRKGARIGNMREKTGEEVLFERYFQKISRKEARFGKIMENTKKVAGGRGGVKVATGKAELAVRRAWRS